MRVCVVGDLEDLSAAYVGWIANERGIDVCPLAEDRIGLDWSFEWTDQPGEGTLEIEGERIPLADVAGAFVRLNPQPAVPAELGVPEPAEPLYTSERRQGLHWLLDHAPFSVVNRPRAGRSNGSKPWQMRALADHGFQVPAWTVTNDPDAARDFIDSCPEGAVYKASSGLRSHVRTAGEELMERLAGGTAPVLLQRYVPGEDARVHVVGEEVFATRIHSAGIDYRFDGEQTEYHSAVCPPEIVRLSVSRTAAEGLQLAGLDFRIDGDGTWWCLELNPVPTFLPYEAGTGHPIGSSVVDLLAPGTGQAPSESPLYRIGSAPSAP